MTQVEGLNHPREISRLITESGEQRFEGEAMRRFCMSVYTLRFFPMLAQVYHESPQSDATERFSDEEYSVLQRLSGQIQFPALRYLTVLGLTETQTVDQPTTGRRASTVKQNIKVLTPLGLDAYRWAKQYAHAVPDVLKDTGGKQALIYAYIPRGLNPGNDRRLDTRAMKLFWALMLADDQEVSNIDKADEYEGQFSPLALQTGQGKNKGIALSPAGRAMSSFFQQLWQNAKEGNTPF